MALCQAEAKTAVLRRDARRLGVCQTATFELIFLDPPYGIGRGEQAFKSADEGGWIAPNALLVWEENTTISVPNNCQLVDARRYGDTTITLLRYQS